MHVLILSLKQIYEEGKDRYSYILLKDEEVMIQEGLAIVHDYIAIVSDQVRARIPVFQFFVYFFFNCPIQTFGLMVSNRHWVLSKPRALHSSWGQHTLFFRPNPACCLFL